MGLLDALWGLFGGKNLNVKRRFELLDKPFVGTYSIVHKAREKRSKKLLALKLLDASKLEDYRQRFEKLPLPDEGTVAQALQHPNIVRTLETGETNQKQPYLLMEWVDGFSLTELMKFGGSQLVGNRVLLIRQMAEAVKAVHEAGYLHRDICPENFVVTADLKSVKLIDFGLTVPLKPEYVKPGIRFTRHDYMAPELFRQQDTGVKLDMFSFGVTAYQMCALKFPWDEEKTQTTIARAIRGVTDIRRRCPKLHLDLANAIMRCLVADPDERTGSMAEFLQHIRLCTQDEQPARQPFTGSPASKAPPQK